MRNHQIFFSKWLCHFTFPQAVNGISNLCNFLLIFVFISVILILVFQVRVNCYLIWFWLTIPLTYNYVEHIQVLGLHIPSKAKCLHEYFAYFLIKYVVHIFSNNLKEFFMYSRYMFLIRYVLWIELIFQLSFHFLDGTLWNTQIFSLMFTFLFLLLFVCCFWYYI